MFVLVQRIFIKFFFPVISVLLILMLKKHSQAYYKKPSGINVYSVLFLRFYNLIFYYKYFDNI